MNRRQTLALGAVGAIAAAGGVAWSLRRAAPAPAAAQAAAPALDAVETELWASTYAQPDGGHLAFATLRGKPVLLNFWATWCAPCLKEMPLLDSFHRSRQAAGWTVVGLAVDSLDPVREYLQRLPVAFPIGIAGMDGAELSRRLGNTQGGLPFTVVFDRRGKAVDRHLGAVDEARLAQWERQHGQGA